MTATTDQVKAALHAHLVNLNVKQEFDGEAYDERLELVLNHAIGDKAGTKLLLYIAQEAASLAVYFHHNPRKVK